MPTPRDRSKCEALRQDHPPSHRRRAQAQQEKISPLSFCRSYFQLNDTNAAWIALLNPMRCIAQNFRMMRFRLAGQRWNFALGFPLSGCGNSLSRCHPRWHED